MMLTNGRYIYRTQRIDGTSGYSPVMTLFIVRHIYANRGSYRIRSRDRTEISRFLIPLRLHIIERALL